EGKRKKTLSMCIRAKSTLLLFIILLFQMFVYAFCDLLAIEAVNLPEIFGRITENIKDGEQRAGFHGITNKRRF
ncbi:MAG: hypothetical protein II376_04105, partial [Clostridia bacterium]|nr:hypothetical protein [Clostridia bacterium]